MEDLVALYHHHQNYNYGYIYNQMRFIPQCSSRYVSCSGCSQWFDTLLRHVVFFPFNLSLVHGPAPHSPAHKSTVHSD